MNEQTLIDGLKDRIAILESALNQANRVQAQWQHASEQLRTAQGSLKESRDRFLALFEYATNGMVVANTDGDIQSMNAEAHHIFGCDQASLPQNVEQIFPAYPQIMSEFQVRRQRVRSSLITHQDEASMLRCDGAQLTASLSLIAIVVAGKNLLLLSVQDITRQLEERERHQGERQELQLTIANRASRLLKLSQALDAAMEPVVICNTEGVIEYVNPAYCHMWGYAPSEVMGKPTSLLKSNQHDNELYADMWERIMAGGVWEGRLINRCRDGQLKAVSLSISPVFDRQGGVSNFIGLYRDLTQQEYMSKQVLQSQKMEAVSTLVGGISHEFNNILAGMTGNLYLAKMLYPNDEEMMKYLDSAEQQGFKAAEMIQMLMVFARKDWVEEKVLELNTLIQETCTLGRLSIPENIAFSVDVCEQILMVRADTAQIQQMLLHLVQNSHDALRHAQHGKISIQLKSGTGTADFIAQSSAVGVRHYAQIIVRDNGIGIREKDKTHIFEPFYTSKDTGEGTGLGLAAVFGVIERLGGTIQVDSKPGDTQFSIYIPIAVADEAPVAAAKEVVDVEQENQPFVILLVDDETEVLAITSKILSSLNYKVIEARNGLEAMRYYEDHSDSIDLVVTDIIMPELSGIEAVERMRCIRESLPVIFITGYDQEYFEQQVEEDEKTRLVLKPLRIGELSKIIRQMLAEDA
ncbi:MAG: PAS domain S-box protein [Mariprofundaceae bacterium]|nr:PAS domain S-box protein [Mariprofundaceae bacterium]